MEKIRVGIVGYGNLGRGVELAIQYADDMELIAVFTRRAPEQVALVNGAIPVYHVDDLINWQDRLDVLVLCGGSANDLPEQTPAYAKWFHVVDSFDNHAHIPEHYARVDEVAKANDHVAVISVGWDPGLFSLNRIYADGILPKGETYTFWGKGVSQGHSDAIRRIPGVVGAKQYTIPVPEAMAQVRAGENPLLSTREKHLRECYVVLAADADPAEVEAAIVNMPDYFAPYDTTVHFISQEELDREHSGIPHGGFVIHSGQTGENGEHKAIIEYGLTLDSNPEFTASVLVAYARAAVKLAAEKSYGAKTCFDIAPKYLSQRSVADLLKNMV